MTDSSSLQKPSLQKSHIPPADRQKPIIKDVIAPNIASVGWATSPWATFLTSMRTSPNDKSVTTITAMTRNQSPEM